MESAKSSQNEMSGETHARVQSTYKKSRASPLCGWCGEGNHDDRKTECKAYGKTCSKCKKENHFRKVCKGKASNVKKESDDQATNVEQSDGTDSSVEALVHGIFELSGVHSIPSTNLVWDNTLNKWVQNSVRVDPQLNWP